MGYTVFFSAVILLCVVLLLWHAWLMRLLSAVEEARRVLDGLLAERYTEEYENGAPEDAAREAAVNEAGQAFDAALERLRHATRGRPGRWAAALLGLRL